ncbi:MAG TPA: efflux RND transporter permease subunit [Rhizomicrobium sp.]|nr:efflux RND transporter permease subunit [Rhizomicrobium sp.]
MTWIVRVALERPLTFIVMALLILIAGPLAALSMPVDIFPAINIPIVAIVFQYGGLQASEVSGRIITPFQRILTTTVDNIEHVESLSLPSAGIVKIFFQPSADIRLAMSQVSAVAPVSIRNMPAGTQPPFIINYNASTVPVLQVAYSSKTLSEGDILDLAQNFIRPHMVSVRGAAIPLPFGGKQTQIAFDLDSQALQAHGLSATDVQTALTSQNQIVPAGFAKIGSYQYAVRLNNASDTVEQMNNLPVKTVNGATIYMRDVAHVREGAPPQNNVVHVNNGRAVLSSIYKNGSASTLDVVQGVKDMLPLIKSQLPDSLNIDLLDDQSVFVEAAVSGVAREGTIAALLTSLMILLFLGSWRSTVIIAISIPLAVLSALAALWATGQTLNIMTLGGLALAVGILVDDATVTIENINWHLEHGKDVTTAIMDGARQIVQPAFVSLLCICIVFVPMFAMKGVAGFLFVPMAMSVVFAMIASFILSRTLVPTMAMYLLKPHAAAGAHQAGGRHALARIQMRFERGFAWIREGYRNLLALAMSRRRLFVTGFLAVVAVSFLLVPFLGENFFPSVDAGQMELHARMPTGTRIEDTLQAFGFVENDVRKVIPPRDLDTIIDNIGLSQSFVNLVYLNSGAVGAGDGDILISLKPGHRPTADYMRRLREVLPRDFPGVTFSFPPADMVGQILNFGTPAPIDVQVTGTNLESTTDFATRLLRQLRGIPGVADPRMQQANNAPQLRFDADRSRIAQYGLTEQNVTNALATSLAGTGTTAPNFWLNPKNNVSYGMVTQMPEYNLDTITKLENLPVTGGTGPLQVLGGLGRFVRTDTPAVISQYNVLPAIDLYAAVQDRDLGAVAQDVQKMIDQNSKYLPRGSVVTLRGQAVTMNEAFSGLLFGLMGAIVLIYLLIVVNFQSWLDPFVIITALPAALAGIVWTLFATSTTLSVPALTGAIMCMGVATANSILVVSFARERLAATGDPIRAAVEAGFVRFRPVIMTALAMIIGMAPLALGLGEGGEQNAPLGRAVIGGLIFATCATLMFVPVVFSMVHGRSGMARNRMQDAAAPSGEVYA